VAPGRPACRLVQEVLCLAAVGLQEGAGGRPWQQQRRRQLWQGLLAAVVVVVVVV
jgi:hypothetical protein